MDIFIDARFEPQYRDHPLVLVDVGARGGLKRNWAAARRHLRVLGFEPEQREFGQLAGPDSSSEAGTRYFDVALHDRRGPLRLNVARDRGLTSIYQPNRAFLDSFPDASRFDTVDVHEVQADRLDDHLQAHGLTDVDFLKVDTQGSELLILQGASRVLETAVSGVEVEVEFTPIYSGQPLFAEVDSFLRAQGFLLFDLRPVYWKRAAGRAIGGPRGQIIWADALYLKSTPALGAATAAPDQARRKSKWLKAISIAVLYGYFDYALEITRSAPFTPDERTVIEARLHEGGRHQAALPRFPGKRPVAAAFRRLWKLCLDSDDAWSVSDAELGNLG
ncbi:MAG TPA: FkbM family methyltransferase [Vicinamibacterales bacterium]|jgi:FkbM family methyltransferase